MTHATLVGFICSVVFGAIGVAVGFEFHESVTHGLQLAADEIRAIVKQLDGYALKDDAALRLDVSRVLYFLRSKLQRLT